MKSGVLQNSLCMLMQDQTPFILVSGGHVIPITDKNRSNYVIFIYYKQQVKYYFNSYLYRELE